MQFIIFSIIIWKNMPKKRKLNSKNPKYWSKEKLQRPEIKKRVLMSTANSSVKVYGVWYKDN